MIRVTVDLIPFGDEDGRRTIGTAHIINDGSGSRELGNYEVIIMDAYGDPLHEVSVKDFPRLDVDIWGLVFQALKQAYGGRKKPKRRATYRDLLVELISSKKSVSPNGERPTNNETEGK